MLVLNFCRTSIVIRSFLRNSSASAVGSVMTGSSRMGGALVEPDLEGVIVIGSGLAGLTTTLQLLQKGIKVTLLEKTDKFGGNSAKASSGINGAETKFQSEENKDSIEAFQQDTIKSGKGLSKPDLVKTLTKNSAAAIEWLSGDYLGIDLSKVTKLGGHSHARTHRGGGKLPPGFAIISELTKKLESYSNEAENLKIMKQASLKKLLFENNQVNGVEYILDDQIHQIKAKAVVLATGGFSASFDGEKSLLKKYRPDLLNLPLTNGVQTTGDGQRIAERDVGAKLIHMDQIQIHPTGFVQLKPNDELSSAANKWKFLCGELIRGIGGILISPQTGGRFVNELSTRDIVTDAIDKNCHISQKNLYGIEEDKKICLIVVGEKDYLKAKNHIDFYMFQNLMFKGTIKDLAKRVKDLNPYTEVKEDDLKNTLISYNKIIKSQGDRYGRLDFGNEFNLEQELYYGLVTPSIHFSMGGIEINQYGQAQNKEGQVIPNLYAVGEVSGGVHGGNRLGGSSLLECVVFGTVVGKHISTKYKL